MAPILRKIGVRPTLTFLCHLAFFVHDSDSDYEKDSLHRGGFNFVSRRSLLRQFAEARLWQCPIGSRSRFDLPQLSQIGSDAVWKDQSFAHRNQRQSIDVL